MRNERLLKEQKNYIKHVVNKELNKSRIRSKYVPDILPHDESRREFTECQESTPPLTQPETSTESQNVEYSEERNSHTPSSAIAENKVLTENTFRSRIRR